MHTLAENHEAHPQAEKGLAETCFSRLTAESVTADSGLATMGSYIVPLHVSEDGTQIRHGLNELSVQVPFRCRREILRIHELMKLRIFDIETNQNQ